MDFDLDDPLGDLLSDGSNDSFFGASKLKKKSNETKTNTATAPRPTTASKSKMEDLFGIGADKVEEKALDTVSQYSGNFNITSSSGVASEANKPATPKASVRLQDYETGRHVDTEAAKKSGQTSRPNLRKEISFGDADDILSELGFDPKRPKSVKKTNILDDLLGITDSKKVPSPKLVSDMQAPSRKATALKQPDADAGSISSADVGGGRTGSRYSPSLNRSRTTPRKNSATFTNDPLGLFPASQAIEEPSSRTELEESRPRQTKKSSVVDWLGLDSNKESSSQSQQKMTAASQPEPIPSTPSGTLVTAHKTQPSTNIEFTPKANSISNLGLAETIQMINSADAESETALKSLQHQDAQLHIASQMRSQEATLLDMQMKQQHLLRQQETNFNDLLRRQLSRQSALEDSIKRQQEQINAHIQLLMSQPNGRMLGSTALAEEGDQTENCDSRKLIIELEAEVKKFELEKIRLQDLVQSIQANHELELELTESSHKKQIRMLEENLIRLETRLLNGNKSLEEYYEKKVATLETELNATIQKSVEENRLLIENHDSSLQRLRKIHENELDIMRSEHQTMIQNIRESKLLEFSIVQENGSYLTALKNASGYLESASGDLQGLRVDMEEKIDRLHRDREIQLEVREKRLEDERQIVQRSKESTEVERIRLLELVKALEVKLSSVEQSSAEEQWSLRQQRSSLEAEKLAFERERDYIREKQLADEKRIQDLRNQQIMEQKRLMSQLDDERNSVLVEKAKIETMARLNKHPESKLTMARTEIDAAVKVAQDAANQADIERNRLLEMQREFEMKKRELINQEQAIRSKDIELVTSINLANSQKHEAESAAKAAKMLEQKMLLKLQHLQRNFVDLGEREAKLSQEKLELSKERLELQALQKKLFQSRCSLCKIGDKSKEISDILTNSAGLDADLLAHETKGYSIDELFGMNGLDAPISHDIRESTNYIDSLLDAQAQASFNRINRMGRLFEINLSAVPDITDISDNLLDPDLQMVKLDALNTKNAHD